MTLSAFVKKFGKAASFTQEDTSFGAQVQLGYGTPVKGIYPYKIEFHEQDGVFYLSCSSRICPSFVSLQEEKGLEVGRFYGLSDTRWEKGKRNNGRGSLEKIRSS